jgi:Ca2+-binding RTX toxin-like protein
VFAQAGVDRIAGHLGDDNLWALIQSDVPLEGVDRVDGGAGDDTIHTRDGEADEVTCGEGDDRALLDEVDVITDASAANPNGSCEEVVREAPRPSDEAPELVSDVR